MLSRFLLAAAVLAAVWLLLRRGPGRDAIVIPSENASLRESGAHDEATAFMAAMDAWRVTR